MTNLVLVRHGETEWHQENRYAGVSDVALTPRGLDQATQLAQWAKQAGLAAIWSSTLTRAKLTAATCGETTNLAVQIDARLCELDFGDGEGLTAGEMNDQFPDALNAFQRDPVENFLPGGEDPIDAARRFTECLHDIARQHPDARVLVVAHTTAIRLALCQILGVPLREYRRLFPVVHNCALTELRISGSQVSVVEFNTPIDRHLLGDRAIPKPNPSPKA